MVLVEGELEADGVPLEDGDAELEPVPLTEGEPEPMACH